MQAESKSKLVCILPRRRLSKPQAKQIIRILLPGWGRSRKARAGQQLGILCWIIVFVILSEAKDLFREKFYLQDLSLRSGRHSSNRCRCEVFEKQLRQMLDAAHGEAVRTVRGIQRPHVARVEPQRTHQEMVGRIGR